MIANTYIGWKFSCCYSNNCASLGNKKKERHQAKKSIKRRIAASGGSYWLNRVGGVKKQFAHSAVGEKQQMVMKKSSLYRETADEHHQLVAA